MQLRVVGLCTLGSSCFTLSCVWAVSFEDGDLLVKASLRPCFLPARCRTLRWALLVHGHRAMLDRAPCTLSLFPSRHHPCPGTKIISIPLLLAHLIFLI